MKKLILIVLGLLVIVIVVGTVFVLYLSRDLEQTQNETIQVIELATIDDGTYRGTYEQGRFTTTIEVVVENHQFTSIVIIDDVQFTRQEVVDEFIEQLTHKTQLEVDGIAGATVTLNAYLKAIENALLGGNE